MTKTNNSDTLSGQALALLQAAAFTWTDGQLSWAETLHAANVMRGAVEDCPTSLKALTARIVSDQGRKDRQTAISALTWDGAPYRVVYQIRSFSGETVWIEERGKRIAGKGSKPTVIQGVVRDIDNEKREREKVAFAATHDPLTGLWNDARLQEALNRQIAACLRYDFRATLFTLQISNIDDINRDYGFEAGDRLLKGVAERLNAHVRAPDHKARLTGNGFDGAVFGVTIGHDPETKGTKEKTVRAPATRLIEILTDTPYPSPYGDLYANLAISATDITAETNGAHDALDKARIALDHSLSRAGKFVPWTKTLEDLTERRRKAPITADDILEALNSRNIRLAYQPIVDSRSRRPAHFECLLRLQRPDGQVVPAGAFIMAAEKLDLVHLLDRRALEIAGVKLKEQPDIRLALNISAATLKNDVAVAGYIAALKALGPMASRVIIELTETAALDDPATAGGFSTAVRSLGCTFAIDDFGAGYTTFQNLMVIEADEIKIDGSFIRDLSVTRHKQVFVRMIVDLAQTFGVKTVAEFVTTPEDADLLTRLGVDYLQGYLFGVPNASPDWPSAIGAAVPAGLSTDTPPDAMGA